MTTRLSIKVVLNNGETMTFKDDSAAQFEFMSQGLFFVEGAVEVKKKERGTILDEVTYRNVRQWIPIAQIKNVEIITWKTINEPQEVKKWLKFKEHGLDIMVTKISHTNPKTQEEVEAEIKKEEKKKERKSN